MKLLTTAAAILTSLLLLTCPAFAVTGSADSSEPPAEAENITSSCIISADGNTTCGPLTDDSHYTYFEAAGDKCTVEISSPVPAGGVYIKFAAMPEAEWSIATEDFISAGGTEMLHRYIPISPAAQKITLSFPYKAKISDIYVLSEGAVPSWVQIWKPPYKCADLMLMSTHSDDEHLFFAGILPYCSAHNIKAQVVYTVNHNDSDVRPHELLDGLWEAGITHYPVIGEAPDLYCKGLAQAKSVFAAAGYSEDFFIAWQVENIRRFKPLVIVEHADDGEYGHGAHILNNVTMKKAVELSANGNIYPESAEKYGTWDVPKLYVHMYQENQIVLNWDEPLEYFGGRTAFQVSQDAYRHHRSQHIFTSLSDWLYGKDGVSVTAAAQIGPNSPCKFGLYRSLVGEDTVKNSFFENVTLYEPETEPATEPETEPPTNPPETEAPVSELSETEPPTAAERYYALFGGNKAAAILLPSILGAAVLLSVLMAVIASRSHRKH